MNLVGIRIRGALAGILVRQRRVGGGDGAAVKRGPVLVVGELALELSDLELEPADPVVVLGKLAAAALEAAEANTLALARMIRAIVIIIVVGVRA
ncbi:hypothetical protein BN1708_002710 [Verticillium longisporum]|uniref:Uncharacterized protein n=1 Tax=Verticillium longisporum TaxID=100787 RepID=A0A0G4KXF1_VERLO|nr:hypothetical protein BN1708_002710 [Verticillium longisporum]